MTSRQLEIFIRVAECGRMSTVARDMFVTQSSISQAISDIEHEFGVRLFERLSKKLYLTATGTALLEYARHIRALEKEVEAFLKEAASRLIVHVGGTITVGASVLSPLETRLHEEHPEIQTRFFVANTHILEEKLTAGELDVALIEGDVRHPDLIARRIMEDELVLICGRTHPFFGKETISLSELAGQSFIFRESGSNTRAQICRQLEQNDIPYKIAWESYSVDAIRNAVIDGHGISMLSSRLVDKELRNGELWKCAITDFSLKRGFHLVYHKNKYLSEALSKFIMVAEAFGASQEQ